MRRGTTPTNTFTLDIDLSAATVFISYAQANAVVVEKTGTDLTFTNNGGGDRDNPAEYYISVTLSQEDTLKFIPGDVAIQIRYVTSDGVADASNIIRTTAERILKDGEISYAV